MRITQCYQINSLNVFIMKQLLISMRKMFFFLVFFIGLSSNTFSQIIYKADGKLTIGNTEPYEYFHQTVFGNGMYFKCKTSNFFQIDVTPAATRLASHYDQVVFYNSKTSTFNAIQVSNVYNYSDARSKVNISNLTNGLSVILKLRPVTYDFVNNQKNTYFTTGGNAKEIGLLAQEVEAILPEIVLTDEEGEKFILYSCIG